MRYPFQTTGRPISHHSRPQSASFLGHVVGKRGDYKLQHDLYSRVTIIVKVVTRMDTSKSGWIPYVNYTTLYSTPRYVNLKSGEIRVKDNCARKRVGYRV